MLMISYSVQSLLISYSKSHVTYSSSVAVAFAELLKLIFALAMLPPKVIYTLPKSASWLYAVPATLYTLQNRLVFEALRFLGPPEYQLLNNMKLFTTSIVFRVVMKRQLRVFQWLALIFLGLGMAVATTPTSSVEQTQESHDLWTGTIIMITVAWCSAAAGVLNEWLIKKSSSVLEANVWLYLFGVITAVAPLPWSDPDGGYLEGFSTSVFPWSVVLCNAVLGQSIAFLFRYADSIVKLQAVCAAMALTTLLSRIFFDYKIHFHALGGYLVTFLSMCLYYTPSEVLVSTDAEFLSSVDLSKYISSTEKSATSTESTTSEKSD